MGIGDAGVNHAGMDQLKNKFEKKILNFENLRILKRKRKITRKRIKLRKKGKITEIAEITGIPQVLVSTLNTRNKKNTR